MNHNTNLEKTYPSGAEKWVCPTCGREVLWQWPPLKLKSIVLVEGDLNAIHSGVKKTSESGISGLKIEISDEEFPPNLRNELDDILKNLD